MRLATKQHWIKTGLKVWQVAADYLLRTLTRHSEAVVAVAFSHWGTLLASTSDDKTITLWDTRTCMYKEP